MKRNNKIEDKIYSEKYLIELAKEYLKVLKVKKQYKCFYIKDNFEIQEGYGYIDNNELYNYHTNTDISENTLFVKGTEGWNSIPNSRWWTLTLNEAKRKQSQLINLQVVMLTKKIEKVQNTKNVIKFL